MPMLEEVARNVCVKERTRSKELSDAATRAHPMNDWSDWGIE